MKLLRYLVLKMWPTALIYENVPETQVFMFDLGSLGMRSSNLQHSQHDKCLRGLVYSPMFEKVSGPFIQHCSNLAIVRRAC